MPRTITSRQFNQDTSGAKKDAAHGPVYITDRGRPAHVLLSCTMTTHFFGDTAVLLGRSLRHITRSLDTIITTAVMPIAILLLFAYVFGGAIDTGSDSYVN